MSEIHPLDRLFATIAARKAAGDTDQSYTARLLSQGVEKCAKKFGEEAVETVLAAVSGDKAQLAAESADVLYHLLVLWAAAGISPGEVYAACGREGQSGLAEKASRGVYIRACLARASIGEAFDQVQHALAHLGVLDLHEGQDELQTFAAGDEFHHRRRAFRRIAGPFLAKRPPTPS